MYYFCHPVLTEIVLVISGIQLNYSERTYTVFVVSVYQSVPDFLSGFFFPSSLIRASFFCFSWKAITVRLSCVH